MPEKNPKVKLGLKNLAMLPSHFDYIFVHQEQKVRLRHELSPKFLSTLGPNPARLTTLMLILQDFYKIYPLKHENFYTLALKSKPPTFLRACIKFDVM